MVQPFTDLDVICNTLGIYVIIAGFIVQPHKMMNQKIAPQTYKFQNKCFDIKKTKSLAHSTSSKQKTEVVTSLTAPMGEEIGS